MIAAEEKERKARACIIPVCAGERFDLVHKFPREDDRTLDWLKAVDLPRLYSVPLSKLRSAYFICSRHFRKTDYKNAISRFLNKTAVPCINLRSLDQIDEAYDRCVRRPDGPGVDHRATVRREEICSLDAANANDDTTLSSQTVKSLKTNLGYRLSTLNANILNVDPVPRSVRSPKYVQNVERFIVSVVDIKSFEQNAPSGCCSDVSVDNDHPAEETDLGENAASPNQCEEPSAELNEESSEQEESIEVIASNVVLQELKPMSESEMPASLLEINHPIYTEPLKLENVWLRDHCRCPECYNEETHQRRLDILDIPLDIKPDETEIQNDVLWVKWQGGHESQYDIDFLFRNQSSFADEIHSWEPILWDQDTVHQMDYSRVNFNIYLSDDEVAKSVVASLLEFGFAFIEKVPPNPNTTEIAMRRLFPIQKTFFGEMWTFSDGRDHSDTAYTNEFLGLHTDNTYWSEAAGLQAFHCTNHSGSGGETLFTDGFKVINDLKTKDPKSHNELASIHVPAEYIENDTHYVHSAPMIRLDKATNRPLQIRYNVYDRATFNTIPQSEMYSFYRSFRSLAEEVNREENQWRFKLNPGTVLIFDNWRILHGREKYTGKRQITGCYVARSDFLSVARSMGLIS